jgi:V8-like Glu-specific endopeptidase
LTLEGAMPELAPISTPALPRRICLCLGLLALLAMGAFPAAARAAPGAVVHAVASHEHPRAFWTPERIAGAQPLPLEPAGTFGAAPQGVAEPAGTPSFVPASAPGEDAGARPQDGIVPAAAADPGARGTDQVNTTTFPNSANGFVLFFYGSSEYQCSGSVVNSPAGNQVLTAGHCVIGPGDGTRATDIVFIPGYREGAEPFGVWPATSFATTPEWESTAGTSDTDEAGDIALLTLANRSSDGATVQSVVGGFGIGFNQPRVQSYMEYGYPAETPYHGDRLYELNTLWGRDDPSFSPATMGISSDFTAGSSGGPWLVGSPPVALSVNDYTYTALAPPSWRGYMYGPYFGAIAEDLYNGVTPAPAAASAAAPSNRFSVVSVTRRPSRGSAVLGIEVSGPGTLALSGEGLRRAAKPVPGAGIFRLAARPAASTRHELRSQGSSRVQATIAFTPSGGSASLKVRQLVLRLRG